MSRIAVIDHESGEITVRQTQHGGGIGNLYHWDCSCGEEKQDFPNRTKAIRSAEEHAEKHDKGL